MIEPNRGDFALRSLGEAIGARRRVLSIGRVDGCERGGGSGLAAYTSAPSASKNSIRIQRRHLQHPNQQR